MGKVWKRRWLRERSAAAQRRAAAEPVVEAVQEEQPVTEPKKAPVQVAVETVEKEAPSAKKAPSTKKAPKVKKAFKPKKK